jgi:hypothetical protein
MHGMLSLRGPMFMIGPRNLLCFQCPDYKQILCSVPFREAGQGSAQNDIRIYGTNL